MTAVKGKYTRWLLGTSTYAYDFSGQSNSLEVSLTSERLDTSAFQETAATSIAGDTSGTIMQNGYWNYSSSDATQNIEERVQAAIDASAEQTVAAIFDTTASAPACYVARQAQATSMKIDAPVSGVITLSSEWPEGVGIVRGRMVWRGTFSGTGAQSAPAYIDLGAVGTVGGYAWLYVTGITGTATNATITLQSDDNTGFSSPATEATFTFSGSRYVEQALTGTVDRYLRLNVTSMGGATNFAVVAIAAVGGVTY
jgi:hypothetical protein